MTHQDVVLNKILRGTASRYIKRRWVLGSKLSTQAFDLREGQPPETYVSHFLVHGKDEKAIFSSAYSIISKRLRSYENGGVALLNIAQALDEVNDGATPFIEFIEQGLPHCGLVFKTNDQQEIQEAKATLCLLAERRMMSISAIANDSNQLPDLQNKSRLTSSQARQS